jgi:bis(5'-adenosyl)-triphosphatase
VALVAAVPIDSACRIPTGASSRHWMIACRPVDSLLSLGEQQLRLDHFHPETLANVLCLAAQVTTPDGQFTFASIGDPLGARRRSQIKARSHLTAVDALQATLASAVLHVIERTKGDFSPNNAVYRAIQQQYVAMAAAGDGPSSLETLLASAEPPEDSSASTAMGGQSQTNPLCDDVTKVEANRDACSPCGGPFFWFFPHRVDVAACIPFASAHFVVLVNLKPIVPFHLMIVPRRLVPSIQFLLPDEFQDWGRVLATCFAALKVVSPGCSETGFSVAVQQGLAAGQTVAHLHTHVIPFDPDGVLAGEPEDDDAGRHRKARTVSEMAAETEILRTAFSAVALDQC